MRRNKGEGDREGGQGRNKERKELGRPTNGVNLPNKKSSIWQTNGTFSKARRLTSPLAVALQVK